MAARGSCWPALRSCCPSGPPAQTDQLTPPPTPHPLVPPQTTPYLAVTWAPDQKQYSAHLLTPTNDPSTGALLGALVS